MGRSLLGATALLLAAPAAARAADTVYATTGTQLLRFTTASTQPIGAARTITGLNGGETIRSIDVRPVTGRLYGLTSSDRVVTIDPRTGAATLVGNGPAIGGGRHAIDFNPVLDRIRVVSEPSENYRLNPNAQADPNDPLAFNTDTALVGAGGIGGVAYDRNRPGGASTGTTLFGIDFVNDALVRIGGVNGTPSPNGGAVTQLGPLGVDASSDAGFDISHTDGRAFASLKSGGAVGFYGIDLTTGAASPLGPLPGAVVDIAVGQPRLSLWTALSEGGAQVLVRTFSDAPAFDGESANVLPVEGLAGGEVITGLDQRPATGDLLALTNLSRLYVIDLPTGLATPIGGSVTPVVGTTALGFDVNPVADRVRLVTAGEQNLRVNPDTGAVTEDSPLNPSGDVSAAAYTNAFPGASSTTLFDIDSSLDRLLVQDPPNSGTVAPVALGTALQQFDIPGSPVLDVGSSNGFDVAPAGGPGFLATIDGGVGDANLYRVVLTDAPAITSRVTRVGSLGVGFVPQGLAVMSPGTFGAGPVTAAEASPVARVAIVRTGGASGPANVEYATADGTATAGGDYTAVQGVASFADGERITVIDVPLTNDGTVEPDETFTLQLSRAGEGAVLGPLSSAPVTIVSDDVAPPEPTQTTTVTTTVPGPATTVPGPATTVPGPATTVTTPAPPAVTVPGPPASPPAEKDTTKPLAFLVASGPQTLRGIASKGFKLQLLSGEPAAATLTLRVDAATQKKLKLKSRTIGTARATFPAAGVKTLSVKLVPAAAKAVRAAKKPARLTVDAVVTDTAGNRSTTTTQATLARR